MIHHVQLACPPGSEDPSRAFFRDLLGLAELAKPRPAPPAAAAGSAATA
jgi:catechol 2,3-dioxygenase-like lactoylglutathione lyase family enzyme